MADADNAKKYYWLKLKRDFFKRHDIRIVEEMPNGKDYVLFYLKMLVESIDHDGELRFSETIPYNEQMLSVITNTNIDIVRAAMKLFIELKMIDLLDDMTIYMNEVQRLIGNETAGAERVRKHRAGADETKRLLQCNADVTKCNTEIELEKDQEPEKKTEKKRTKGAAAPTPRRHQYGEYSNVLLSNVELDKLQTEIPDWQKMIDRLSGYMRSTGKHYDDHLATMRNWHRDDKDKGMKPAKVVSAQQYEQRPYDSTIDNNNVKRALEAAGKMERKA